MTETIEFLEYHKPALAAGTYTISVEQTLSTQKSTKISGQPPFTASGQFAIQGPHYTLDPSEIQMVFPPAGNLGDHANALPHVVFTRSTLPWERDADSQQGGLPWLALLLLEDSELGDPTLVLGAQTLPLSDLEAPTTGSLNWPGRRPLEAGEQDSDLVTVIDVSQTLLAQLLPTAAELPFLAHVRKTTDGDSSSELAVIIGKRIPPKGSISTVHLVSLEGRYTGGQFIVQNAGPDAFTRLLSLKSWQFACVADEQQFQGLLTHLDRNPGTLCLPPVGNTAADASLAVGYTLLPHNLRQGEQTVSWYHGPFITGDDQATFDLPARAADALVRYDPSVGLFDVSYAAAWELGRLLALQNKAFSTALYLWKRTYASQHQQIIQQSVYSYLPLQTQVLLQSVDTDIPETISGWFRSLSLLQGVPFNYLVPDERMLPAESMRFFCVDPLWTGCLLDGAFSIGRATLADHMQDGSYATNPAAIPYPNVSGFLLRSAVIAGWPTLDIAASDQVDYFTSSKPTGSILNPLRTERLSANVLLCLFEGKVQSVAISEKPESLHFGFDLNTELPQNIYKKLRDAQGVLSSDPTGPLPWQVQTRVVDIVSLAPMLAANCTSALFAYQMVEQGPRIVFAAKME